MFIVVNKDFSIAQIAPSTIYQGSNLANELAVFAPFSVTAYTAIEVAIALPSGEYLSPLLAFPTATQPDGFGAWSMELPSTVTTTSGTAKFSLSFIGVNNAKMVTEAAEFSIYAAIPTVPVPDPDPPLYVQILSYISEVLSRKPNWLQTNPNADDYISNKPPIVATRNLDNEVNGATVNGTLNVDGSEFINDDLYVNGVRFVDKLDKATVTGKAAYTVDGNEQGTTSITTTPTEGAIPAYRSNGRIAVGTPVGSEDCVNKGYLDNQLREKVLPQWVSNLSNVTSDTRNTPPTSGAVIRYASPAIIGTVTGNALMIDDFSDISGQTPIRVDFPNGSSVVEIYGKNLFDMNAVTTSNGTVTVNEDSFTWSTASNASGTFYLELLVNIPANTTFTYSFAWNAESSSDVLGRTRFYNGGTELAYTANGATRGTFTFEQPLTTIRIYKNPATSNLVGAVNISQPTLTLGTSAEYTTYQTPVTKNPVNSYIPSFPPPFSEGITIIPVTPSVITATYTRDSTKVINNIFELIAEIQEAIAT